MSTDLEFRLPMIKTINSTSSTNNYTTDECISSSSTDELEESCHTPKSPQHVIPSILSCPPAPKKPRRAAASSCNYLRKVPESRRFFEMVAREEIESFFRRVIILEVNFNGATKRKRPM